MILTQLPLQIIEFFIKVESDVADTETRVLNLNKGNYDDMRQ